jgi:hypothetical protein
VQHGKTLRVDDGILFVMRAQMQALGDTGCKHRFVG